MHSPSHQSRSATAVVTAAVIAATALAVLALSCTVRTASAAVGNTRLAQYFGPNPIGGSPIPLADLRGLVDLEQRATSAFDPGVVIAAQGWSNTKTHARFIELALALSQNVSQPDANARETVTSACGGAGGTVASFHSIPTIQNGYEAACRPVTTATAKPFEILTFVKENVFVIFFNFSSTALPLAKLNTLAAQQYSLIPSSGIPRTTLA